MDKEDFLSEEDLKKIPGYKKICQMCLKEISEKDINKGNLPNLINNFPGYVHTLCKVDFDSSIISTGKITNFI